MSHVIHCIPDWNRSDSINIITLLQSPVRHTVLQTVCVYLWIFYICLYSSKIPIPSCKLRSEKLFKLEYKRIHLLGIVYGNKLMVSGITAKGTLYMAWITSGRILKHLEWMRSWFQAWLFWKKDFRISSSKEWLLFSHTFHTVAWKWPFLWHVRLQT